MEETESFDFILFSNNTDNVYDNDNNNNSFSVDGNCPKRWLRKRQNYDNSSH